MPPPPSARSPSSFSPERWWPSAALAAGGFGSAFAVAAVARQDGVRESPASALGREQSATALFTSCPPVWRSASRSRLSRAPTWAARAEPRSRPRGHCGGVRRLVATIAVVDPLAASVHSSGPRGESPTPTNDFVRSHLLSANGSGRWQFWEIGGRCVPGAPLRRPRRRIVRSLVGGARQPRDVRPRRPLALPRDARRAGVAGLRSCSSRRSRRAARGVAGSARFRRGGSGPRSTSAAFVAFCAAAAIDWMWELTVVSRSAFACLALTVGAAARSGRPRAAA